MIRSNLQHIIAIELQIWEISVKVGMTLKSDVLYFCKKGTLATVFLGTLLGEFNWKLSIFNPFFPLSCPSESKRYLTLVTTFSCEISRENSDVISKSLVKFPRENKKPLKQSHPDHSKLWEKFRKHLPRAT